MANNNINYGPAPLPGTTTAPVLGNNIDRGPAAVPPGPATGVNPVSGKPVIPVFEQPVVVPARTVNSVIPVTEQPVDLGGNANAVAGPNLTASNQQRYITVLQNGNIVVTNVNSLNFLGNGVTVTQSGVTGANITINTGGGGGGNGTPGGSNTQIQFNNAGEFGGSSHFTFNKDTLALTVDGTLTVLDATVYGTINAVSGVFSNVITMTSTPYSASNQIKYGLGNLIAWNDGGWTIGEFNGNTSAVNGGLGNEGIRIDPGIESNVGIWFPGVVDSGTQPVNIYSTGSNSGIQLNTAGGSWNFGNTGILTAPGNISAVGNVQANAFVGAQANVDIVASGNTWVFDTSGNLTTPANTIIGPIPGIAGGSILQPDSPLQVLSDGANGFAVMGWAEISSAPSNTSAIHFNSPVSGGNTNVAIVTGNIAATQYNWVFDGTGNLTTPTGAGDITMSGGNITGVNTVVGDQANVDVIAGSYTWRFDTTGNLTLPNVATIVGATANNSGSLQWIGNSSGDGYGYTTLQLRPDNTLTGDQWLVIDPTSPNHIHIRAGGVQDNSNSYLFLGGENSYFQVPAGSNPNVHISANNQVWTFDATSKLSIPNNGTITTPDGTGGDGGYFVEIVGGASDQSTWNSNPGGNVNIWGGAGSYNDGYGAIGGSVNLYGGLSPENTSGNVTVNTGTTSQYNWNFDNSGYLNLPANGDFAHIQTGNNKSLTIETPGDTLQRIQITPADGVKIYANNDAYMWQFNNSGTLTAPGNISAGNFIGGGSNVDIVAGAYDWRFDNTGNLSLPGNTFAVNYANGTPVSLGGGTYGNSNVATFLAAFGSNTISTTGNITTTNNIFGNAITLKNSDDFAQILFSSDGGSTNNGQIKVDGGTNMVISSGSNFYVKRAGSDRIAVTDTTADFMATTNVRIQSNKGGTAKTWTFDTAGNLAFPSGGAFMSNVRTVTGGSVPSGFYPTYYNPTTGEFIVVTP